MPEQPEPPEALGLVPLSSDEPFELPAAPGVAAELVTDPTGRPADRAQIGRKWYQGLGWGFWVAAGVVILWILLAIFAGMLPLQNPDHIQPLSCALNSNPSSAHWLGCDSDYRDILSRVIFGSRVSMVVGFGSIVLSLAVGGPLGVLAGYFRGRLDEVLGIAANVFLSFPSLVLALVIVAYLGNSEFDIVLIIAIVAWPILFRVVRASTIEFSQREYVLAEQALGATRSRILLKVLLPDIVPSAITYSLVGVALAIVAEGALSFLGQSVGDPIPTWGNMIAAGTDTMPQYAMLLIAPAVAMFSFILAINFVGDRLRSTLDVRSGVL